MAFFVFPGQASQYPGMGKDWFENFSQAKQAFEEGSDGSKLDLKKLCFEGSESDLKATEITQPAILTTSIAIWRCLPEICDLSLGAKTLFAGHSLGEYTALVAAGSLSLLDASSFVRKRGQAMQEAVPEGVGTMLALLFKPRSEKTAAQAEEICEKARQMSGAEVWVANFNSNEQIILAGKTAGIKAAQVVGTEGDFTLRQAIGIEVSAPFHCPLMEPARKALEMEVAQLNFKSVEARYLANVDAKEYSLSDEAELARVGKRLLAQITAPVLWQQICQRAFELEQENYIEIGPKKVLSSLGRRMASNSGAKFKTANIDTLEDGKGLSL